MIDNGLFLNKSDLTTVTTTLSAHFVKHNTYLCILPLQKKHLISEESVEVVDRQQHQKLCNFWLSYNVVTLRKRRKCKSKKNKNGHAK